VRGQYRGSGGEHSMRGEGSGGAGHMVRRTEGTRERGREGGRERERDGEGERDIRRDGEGEKERGGE